jgi:endonuclease-3
MRRTIARKAAPQAKKTAATTRKAAPKAKQAARVRAICDGLQQLYPDAHCELAFADPFQLLVATILSAQCTDKRVNLVTPELFRRFPDAKTMAVADGAELEAIIKSTGFYRNKTKNILGAARVLMKDFGGVVPRTMEELLTLPGVARKTANVILGSAFGLNEGIAVDTHVTRLSQRLGLSAETDPIKIERDLTAQLPRERWTELGHQIIWHGRRVCHARAPECDRCPLGPSCPSAGKAS